MALSEGFAGEAMVERFRRLWVHRAPNVTWDPPEDKVFDKEVKSVRKGVGMRVGDTVSSYLQA